MIRIFTTCIIDDYKAQQVVAGKLAKSINLVLLKESDSTDQEKLKAVGQRYKNSFDRFFVGNYSAANAGRFSPVPGDGAEEGKHSRYAGHSQERV